MLRLLTLFMATVLLGAPTLAQDALIRHFNPAVFEGVLKDAAARINETVTTSTEQLDDGTPLVTAVTSGGTKFGMVGTACSDGGKCVGVNMIVIMEVPPACITTKQVNQWNVDSAYAKYLIMEPGQVALTRYIILDHGQDRQNLVIDAMNYISTMNALVDETANCYS